MTHDDKKTIIKTIINLLPNAHIYLFGSRATKTNQPESDIDIAIDAQKKINAFTLSKIKEALEESSIPFTIDILDLHSISLEFKKQILKEGIAWK